MKHCIIIICCLFIYSICARAQLIKKVGKRVATKVEQRVIRHVDKAVDKGLDQTEIALKSNKQQNTSESSKTIAKAHLLNIASDYDFIPGEEILFYDDFSSAHLGDFPIRWNTNGAGEVVKIGSTSNLWLKVPENTITFPELKYPLPENFTIEFDLYYPTNTTRPPITFGFSEVDNPAKHSIKHKKLFYFRITPSIGDNIGYSTTLYSGQEITKAWPANSQAGKVIRFSIAINGQRIRLYEGTTKLFDLPKAFDLEVYRKNFHFRSAELLPKPKDGFYIGNIRVARASKDLRSQLIDEGKYSTSGIYFDSGSDRIKNVSFNLLNEIGSILKFNQNLKFDVIGHTDSDGADQFNQVLSLQRAEAVREYLIKNFGIEGGHLTAIGRGASSPHGSNTTSEGKALNRRVEFVKK